MYNTASEENEQYSSEEDDVDVDCDSKTQGDKKARAHHNYLERLRRDHIKESFKTLKQSLPCMGNERASRATILHSATGYINQLKNNNNSRARENELISQENQLLEQQLREAGVHVPGLSLPSLSRRPAPLTPALPPHNAPSMPHYSVPLEHQLGAIHTLPHGLLAPTLHTRAPVTPTPPSNPSHTPPSQESDDSDDGIEPLRKRSRPHRRPHPV